MMAKRTTTSALEFENLWNSNDVDAPLLLALDGVDSV